MKRILIAILMALCFLVPTTAGAARGGTTNMQYVSYQRTIDGVVEQYTDWPFPVDTPELIKINPLRPQCAWDVDDFTYSIAEGSVKGGQTITSPNECLIATQSPFYKTVDGRTGWWGQAGPWYGAQVTAPTPELIVNVCYAPENHCFVASPVYDSVKKAYVYNSCSQATYSPGDPALTEIPGSQGGPGVINQITTSIKNPTGRNIRGVTSMVGIVGVVHYSDGWGACAWGTPVQYSYPYAWSN